MKIKIDIPDEIETVLRHADLGWQCPECYGVQITKRVSPFYGFEGWQCEECGCQFSPRSKVRS